MVSGGFDPLHIGHVRLINHAARWGQIVVALNSDEWLIRKKTYAFMPFDDRREILFSIKSVLSVVRFDDSDNTICQALRSLQPDYMANGGDRTEADPREHAVCEELGITELFGIGGSKTNSSSDLVREAFNQYRGSNPYEFDE